MLMENTVESAKRYQNISSHRAVRYLKLDIKDPVPSDIEISISQTPKKISEVFRSMLTYR